MRIGITYLYTIFRYGYPHSVQDALRSLPEIRKLGFRFLEMEGLGRRHLLALYKQRKTLLGILNDCGLHVHNFCVVDPDLVALDARKRRQALDRFRVGAELGALLEAETLHLASYAPPVRYLASPPYRLSAKKGYQFADLPRISIPRGFDWDKVWAALVESCRACAGIAAEHGKTVIMEPRIGEVICSVDSQLRLIEHVACPNFQANLDTGHFSAQRENVALAVFKLRGRFANVHLSDNHPRDTEHLPLGEGVTDWLEFFRALKTVGYNGYLGLDLGTRRPLVAGYRKSLATIRAVASKLKMPVEV